MPTYIIFYLIVFVATFAVVSLTNQAKVKKNKNLLDEAKKEGSKVIITKDTILDSDYNISLFLKISGNNILIQWNSVSGATKYQVYRSDGKVFTTTKCSYTDNNIKENEEIRKFCVDSKR